jgi:hypothetical protein
MTSGRHLVGQVRPSQLMSLYGVGAVVDLPRLSVLIAGLEDWPDQAMIEISEPRLLEAVRIRYPTVRALKAPPVEADIDVHGARSAASLTGVPVVTFPRWMVCPRCRKLASVDSDMFTLDEHAPPDRKVYRHRECPEAKKQSRMPEVVPVRFLAMCEHGHLDDFPWIDFVCQGSCGGPGQRGADLYFFEFGPTGESRDLRVKCETCGKNRSMADATVTQPAKRDKLPMCTGRMPHLRSYQTDPCDLHIRAVTLGASNMWFPVSLGTIAVPDRASELEQLLADHWSSAMHATSSDIVRAFVAAGSLAALRDFDPAQVAAAVIARRERLAGAQGAEAPELRNPEWQVFDQEPPFPATADFQTRLVDPPARFAGWIDRVLLVERLRVVHAMLGFTRVDSPGETFEVEQLPATDVVSLTREAPTWLPASETRGEGLFLRFREDTIQAWLARPEVKARGRVYETAYREYLGARKLDPERQPPFSMRYVLLHSLSHALMRQVALECGYSAASLSERIYARDGANGCPPQAGVLLYTSAPDSEGTLGGLVSLGAPATLGPLMTQALEAMRLCASDPLCSELTPGRDVNALNGASCHACLYAPETSCERGNRFLDRAVLVPTLGDEAMAYFVEVGR